MLIQYDVRMPERDRESLSSLHLGDFWGMVNSLLGCQIILDDQRMGPTFIDRTPDDNIHNQGPKII